MSKNTGFFTKVSGFAVVFLLFFTESDSQNHSFAFSIEEENSTLLLHLASTNTLPCIGYGIATVQLWNLDTVIIDIRGFRQPSPCYAGLDIAREEIRLTGERKNSFVLKFRWKKEFDLWKLERRGSTVTVKAIRQTFSVHDR